MQHPLSRFPVQTWLSLAFAFAPLPHSGNAGDDNWITEQIPDIVIGQADFETADTGAEAGQMNEPNAIAIDPITEKVFVADTGNNRVLRFASYVDIATGASAEAVLGQPDFGENTAGLDAATMSAPRGVAVGPSGELWVADSGNNRILRFDDAATKASGSDADGVLGQTDFVTADHPLTQDGLYAPRGLCIDFEGNLVIADFYHDRVLIHLAAASKSDGANADYVLGQEDFTTNGHGTTAASMHRPTAVHLTGSRMLFIADSGQARILIYDDFTALENGANANRVLGQSRLSEDLNDLTSSKFEYPTTMAVSATDRLFVCDHNGSRVLVFENASTINGLVPAFAALGASDFESEDTGDLTTDINSPWGLAIAPDNRVWIADSGHNRVLIFNEQTAQADLTIGDRSNRQKGNNIYNTSGIGQKKRVRTTGRKVKLHCRIGNDGTITDTFTCSGTRSNRKFNVKHFAYSPARTNVTARVKTGTYTSSGVEASGFLRYRMEVKPKASAGSRARINTFLHASSNTDGEADHVVGKVIYQQ